MLNNGAVAVAIVKRQIMVVQASRTHTKRDKYLDVQTYSPFGERIFLASDVPNARIAASDILSVFEAEESTPGMIELPPHAFSEYLVYTARQQKKHERMWSALTSRN